MKKFIIFLLVVSCSFSVNSQSKAIDYKESGFSADFPSKPEVSEEKIDSEIGKIDNTMYLSVSGDYVVILNKIDFPKAPFESIDKAGLPSVLKNMHSQAMKNSEIEMKEKFIEKKSEIFNFDNKYLALKVIGSFGEKTMNGFYIIKSNSVYQIMIFGDADSKNAIQFMNSFKLIE